MSTTSKGEGERGEHASDGCVDKFYLFSLDLLHSPTRSQAGTMCGGAESVGSDRRLLYSTINLLVSFCDLGADRSRD